MRAVLPWLLLGSVCLGGCELVADFDRSKIPVEGADAGSVDGGDETDAGDEADAGDESDAG